ncbi:asparaginase [Nocardia cyriacigeorgica]|uniref:asparaginase n=1 Tax=Nocardia cyriacigeorgica TaxID=135487 RepID=UPI001BB12B2E|nr:asparaginase [Nocardia cyriacigeorgica]
MTKPGRRRVSVFALGGTIAMTRREDGAVTPALSAEQLLSAVPGLDKLPIDIDVVNFRQCPGASLRIADVVELAAAIADRAPDIHGVVVTQGTDTIEETAYLIDLLHTLDLPIVVTGAMRNPTLPGPDGPANLMASISAAADPSTRSLGCLVVFNDEIHAACRVRKSHTTSTATFISPDGGPVGFVVEGRARVVNRQLNRATMPAPPNPDLRVPIATIALGEDPRSLSALASEADGLVVAAMGAGHVPADLVQPLEAIAERIPVVLASRTGSGTVLASTYGFAGSEQDLLNRGLMRGGYIHPLKARLLLQTALSTTRERSVLAAVFAVAGGFADQEAWPWPEHVSREH